MADYVITEVMIEGVVVRVGDRISREWWTVANDNDVVPEADADYGYVILDGGPPVRLDDLFATTEHGR
jgi:hypothetical protein